MMGVEITAYGDGIIERIENWWAGLEDKSCRQKVKTFYGTPPMHQLFERSTWHSAQHARQMIAVLERFGIEPDVRLTADDLAGLPLPGRNLGVKQKAERAKRDRDRLTSRIRVADASDVAIGSETDILRFQNHFPTVFLRCRQRRETREFL